MAFQTPILLLVFNRPNTTKLVFEEIRKQKPKFLYVAADGPRDHNEIDIVNCEQVIEIFNSIDWDCELKTLYRKENLGCKIAVSEAINWFFKHVEEGIILEDDILPDPSFFSFCKNMLELYREEANVMHISGFNVMGKWKRKGLYHFSYFGSIWGWATWKRAWENYNLNIDFWRSTELQDKILKRYFPRKMHKKRKLLYDDLYNGNINTWDYQWTLCRLNKGGLSIIPSCNLVDNIGFSIDATHSINKPNWFPTKSHINSLRTTKKEKIFADRFYDYNHNIIAHGSPSLLDKIVSTLSKIFKR